MTTLSLKQKMMAVAGMMALNAAIISVASFWINQSSTHAFLRIVKDDLPSIRALNRMLLSWRLARIELLQLSASEFPLEKNEQAMTNLRESWSKFDSDRAILEKQSDTPEEKRILEPFLLAYDNGRKEFDLAIRLYSDRISTSAKPSQEAIAQAKKDLQVFAIRRLGGDLGNEIRMQTQKAIDFQAARVELNSEKAESAMVFGGRFSIGFTIFGILAGIVLSFLVARRIVGAIRDQVGVVLKDAGALNAGANQVLNSSGALSAAAAEQVAAVHQTAAALEQISTMVKRSSAHLETVLETSKSAQDKAQEGSESVGQMLNAMGEIQHSNQLIVDQVTHSNRQMGQIVSLIQEISSKTKVINDIVFQTKLLSFNASVEAARAGEHGKGFSVVAEEVGNLARMSGNASKEISALLESSTQQVLQIAAEMKSKVEDLVLDGKEKINTGIRLAGDCSKSLNDIVSGVSTVTALAKEVSQAGTEQAKGVSEISKAMAQLNVKTQQNESIGRESKLSAKGLFEVAVSLNTTIAALTQVIEGHSGSRNVVLDAPFPPDREIEAARSEDQGGAPNFPLSKSA